MTDNLIRLPSNFVVEPDKHTSDIYLKLNFSDLQDGINLIIALSRINFSSVRNKFVIEYLIRHISVPDITSSNIVSDSADLIKKILEADKSLAQYTLKSIIKSFNNSLVELLEHIVDEYSNNSIKELNVTIQMLDKVIFDDNLMVIDILLDRGLLHPQDKVIQKLLHNIIVDYGTVTDPGDWIIKDMKYFVERGVSLNKLFETLSNNNSLDRVNRGILMGLLQIPNSVDPNLIIYYAFQDYNGPVWLLSILFNDYDTFRILVDQGANLYHIKYYTDGDDGNVSDEYSLIWALITYEYFDDDDDSTTFKDPRFFEYLSEIGFSLTQNGELLKNLYTFVVLEDLLDVSEYTLTDEIAEITKRMETYVENLVNLGFDPRNLTNLNTLGEGDEMANDIFKYVREYDYSLASISMFQINKSQISTRHLPSVLRRGDTRFDFVKIISDNLNRYTDLNE